MQHCDKWMDPIVNAWRVYAAERPHEIRPSTLLRGRDLRMYRAMGITRVEDFARQLVDDRSTATLEMSMGHLYERLLEALVTNKVASVQRKESGYRGIDFFNLRPDAVEIINLKTGLDDRSTATLEMSMGHLYERLLEALVTNKVASVQRKESGYRGIDFFNLRPDAVEIINLKTLSTSNADISAASSLNLRNARDYWTEYYTRADDNPLEQRPERVIRMVRAVARGPRRARETQEGILWLVGDDMWEHFGGGPDFLRRLSDALGRNPLDLARYEEAKAGAARRVETYLTRTGLVESDGTVDWDRVAGTYD